MKKQLSATLPILLAILVFAAFTGCARESQQPPASDAQISLSVEPEPPTVGNATLRITVVDAQANPIDDARLIIKGDMSHAGMEPVLAEVEGGAGGVYEVPFIWTMGGDWIVTVQALVDDGAVISRRFDMTVGGPGGADTDG